MRFLLKLVLRLRRFWWWRRWNVLLNRRTLLLLALMILSNIFRLRTVVILSRSFLRTFPILVRRGRPILLRVELINIVNGRGHVVVRWVTFRWRCRQPVQGLKNLVLVLWRPFWLKFKREFLVTFTVRNLFNKFRTLTLSFKLVTRRFRTTRNF